MNERVVEILIYIMQEIRKDTNDSKHLRVISKDLLKKGYTESEISSAFSWLLTRVRSESEEIVPIQGPSLKQSFRMLHEIEHSVVSIEAYGYIIQLKELGIISQMDVENILEKAVMLSSSRVKVEDVKSIVASILFSNEAFGPGHLFLDEDSEIH
jgi:Smg protein